MKEMQIVAEPGVPQVLTTRAFDAPRELVYRAFAEPDLLVRWLGPRKYTMTIDRFDLRDGGTYRYVHADEDGNEYGFHGVFHGEPSPKGIVQTFEFEGYPGHVQLDTATFEEVDGATVVHLNSVFQTVEDRDGMLQSGMETGLNEGFEQLDELLAKPVASD